MDSPDHDVLAKIKVVGVGGGGSNAVSRMFRERIPGAAYIVVNTDAQALLKSDVPLKIRIGDQLTGGKGVGGNPDLGMRSAEESREDLYEVIRDSDMVFIAAVMGGGTGTGRPVRQRQDRTSVSSISRAISACFAVTAIPRSVSSGTMFSTNSSFSNRSCASPPVATI